MRIFNTKILIGVLLLAVNILTVQACGIYGWDPVGYCNQGDDQMRRLATSDLSRLVPAVNYAKQYNTDFVSDKGNLQRAFSDVTAILMELKQFDTKAFEFEVMEISGEVERYMEMLVDHVILLKDIQSISEIQQKLVEAAKP